MNRSLFATLVIVLTSLFVANAQINISFDVTDPSCDGFTNGRIVATASGGTAPYTYTWENGQSGTTIFSAVMGEYTLTVTDADGETATESVTVEAPAPLAVDILAAASVCDGAATTYTATASGGTAPYTYTWSNGQMGNTLNPDTEDVYYVTVEDANGCSNTFPVKVFQPLTVEVVTTATRCPDFCDASAEAVIAGGLAPYTFEWNTGATAQILETLPAGTYTVTVTDANGCQVVGTGVAEAASDIEFSVDVDGTCGGGDVTATVNAEGGNGDIEIEWSTGDTGATVSGLEMGETYSVTVTDVAGCTKREEFTVPVDMALVIDLESENLACGAVMGGSATVMPLGGTAPYSIIWSNGELDTTMISNLNAGDYCVTVIDANGCRGEACTTIMMNAGLNLDVSSTPAICGVSPADGMANVVPSGGTEPYNYAWSDGQSTGTAVGLEPGNYRVTVTDALGCEGLANVTVEEEVDIRITTEIDQAANSATIAVEGGTAPYSINWSNGQTGETATDLVAGECYQVSVTDVNDCSIEEEVCIPTTSIDFTFELTPDCNETGGSASINIIGGVAPYDIQWLDVQEGGTSVDGLSAGTYTVIVTDANGMQRTRFFEIEISSLEVNTSATAVECATEASGTASVEVLDPIDGTYTYAWSDGGTGANRDGLAAGTYMVTVTSPEGCVDVSELTIETEEIEAEFVIAESVNCETGLVMVMARDITEGDVTSWEWRYGEEVITGRDNIFIEVDPSTMDMLEIQLQATTADGCSATTTQTFSAVDYALDVTAPNSVEVCEGEEVSVGVVNNSPETELTYEWSPAELFEEGTTDRAMPTFIGDASAEVSVLVTNTTTNCTVEQMIPVNISEITAPDLSALTYVENCSTVDFMSTEELMDYTWDFGDPNNTDVITGTTNPSFTYSGPGEYTLTLTPNEGVNCREAATITVLVEDHSVQYELSGERSICFGEDLNLNITNLNLADGLSVQWSPEDPMLIDDATSLNPTFMLDETTTFTLTATNECGFELTEEITIEVNELPDAVVSADMTEIFLGQETGVYVETNEQNDVSWESEASLNGSDPKVQTADPEETTTYNVTVIDPETGCLIDETIEIVVLADPCEEPHIYVPNAFTPNRDGINDVLYVRGLHIDEMRFIIHNRWGEEVFQSTEQDKGWDGTHNGDIATGDAFGWYLEVTCFDGTRNVFKGNVTILR